MESIGTAFLDAVDLLVTIAVRGGLLAWGVFMGKVIATGFFDPPTRRKILIFAAPTACVIALTAACYSYFLVINPGETQRSALYDACKTFFVVLFPLWIGCTWGAMLRAEKEHQPA